MSTATETQINRINALKAAYLSDYGCDTEDWREFKSYQAFHKSTDNLTAEEADKIIQTLTPYELITVPVDGAYGKREYSFTGYLDYITATLMDAQTFGSYPIWDISYEDEDGVRQAPYEWFDGSLAFETPTLTPERVRDYADWSFKTQGCTIKELPVLSAEEHKEQDRLERRQRYLDSGAIRPVMDHEDYA